MEANRIIAQFKESFYEVTRNDIDLIVKRKVTLPYEAYAYLIDLYYQYKQNYTHAANAFEKVVGRYFGIDRVSPLYKRAASYFLLEFKDLRKNRSFISAAAALYLPFYKDKILRQDRTTTCLPACEQPHEIFLDLATDFSFVGFFPDLDRNTHYYLVPGSLFAYEGLRQEKENYPGVDIRVMRKSIQKLKETDFRVPVGVIRVKNLFDNTPVAKEEIERLQCFIRPGGQFIFQEDRFLKIEYPFDLDECFRKWEKIEAAGDPEDPDSVSTVTYIKPVDG